MTLKRIDHIQKAKASLAELAVLQVLTPVQTRLLSRLSNFLRRQATIARINENEVRADLTLYEKRCADLSADICREREILSICLEALSAVSTGYHSRTK